MDFRTIVSLPPTTLSVLPQTRMLLMGSCFVEHVGERLQKSHLPVTINPFGVQYNPCSISQALRALINGSVSDQWFFQGADGLFHSWMHTSQFSGNTLDVCRKKVAESIKEGCDALQNSEVLFVTFGTNHIYYLKGVDSALCRDNGLVVSNCHKEPAQRFCEAELSIDEIVNDWQNLLTLLPKHLHIVFTVSPYRYAKYGFHESQLSKSVLLLAIDRLLREDAGKRLHYFPAYEIVMDELRDYRFYESDMLHPSAQAAAYIWERLQDWCFSDSAKQYIKEWNPIQRLLEHRLFTDDAEAVKKHRDMTDERVRQFNQKWNV